MSGKDIAEIARLLDESLFASLDLQMGEFRLRIRRDGGSDGWADTDEDDAASPPVSAQAETSRSSQPESEAEGGSRLRGNAQEDAQENEVDVPAPLLGNFYSAPRPGDDPFVQPGDSVTEDTTIGIIEVMKLMNPIRAGVSGTIVAILAENGTAVEEGQALVRVKVSG